MNNRGFLGSVWPTFVALALGCIFLLIIRNDYSAWDELYRGVYVEAWGTILDIFLVGVLLSVFSYWRERQLEITRYMEEIDDLKKWDSEEARLRIAGNIRRLAKANVSSIDFSGLKLSNFSFSSADIDSLKGSIFSHGLISTLSKNSTDLTEVDFNFVDCRDVIFCKGTDKFSGLGLVGTNLSFVHTKLHGACFDGAVLKWTVWESEQDKWYEYINHEGEEFRHQIYHPPFEETDLSDCSFRYVAFEKCDFRGSENILEANFYGARGLETCFFDEGIREQIKTKYSNDALK